MGTLKEMKRRINGCTFIPGCGDYWDCIIDDFGSCVHGEPDNKGHCKYWNSNFECTNVKAREQEARRVYRKIKKYLP